MTAPALMLVFSEPGSLLSEDEFNDWYDNEHVPLRQAVPGFRACTRLIQRDGETPNWAATYDLDSLSVLHSPAYDALAETRSDREKDVLSRIGLLDRRVYTLNEKCPGSTKEGHSGVKPGYAVVFRSLEVGPEHEDELHRWYEEEHIPLLMKVPGWLSSRIYTLHEEHVTGTDTSAARAEKPPKLLAVHEYDSPDGLSGEEWKAATATPWRNRVMEYVRASERRIFRVYKTF